MPKLTKRMIDSSVPNAKPFSLWCSEVRGFGVRVHPSGRKVFVLRYRTAGGRLGRDRLVTIGDHGTFTVEQARDRARALVVAVRDGIDPARERKSVRSAKTVADLFTRVRSDHVVLHHSAQTVVAFDWHVNMRIVPALGHFALADIERSDIAKFHAGLSSTPRVANHCLAILSKAFSMAEEWGLRPVSSNPARGIQKYKMHHRERFLSPDEVARLGRTLDEASKRGLPWRTTVTGDKAKHIAKPENAYSPVNPVALAVIRFLLLTGARLSEATSLEWSHVNAETATVELPASKGGVRRSHEVSRYTLDLLAAQPRRDGNPFVFPSDPLAIRRKADAERLKKPRPITKSVMENAWQRVRAAAGLDDVHLHDLRHTVGTVASRHGGNAFLIRDLLRHADVSMTQKYVNRDSSPLRDLANAIGDDLGALLDGDKG